MLPRNQRIPSFAIAGVMRYGKRIIDTRVYFFILQNTIGLSRFSFIVPLKIEKRATGRNRIRRLLSESVRNFYPRIQSGWDCIVLVRQKMSDPKQVEVNDMVNAMLRKAGVLLS